MGGRAAEAAGGGAWAQDWFNRRRLLEPLGYVPPAEFEAAYYRGQETPVMVAGLQQKTGLR